MGVKPINWRHVRIWGGVSVGAGLALGVMTWFAAPDVASFWVGLSVAAAAYLGIGGMFSFAIAQFFIDNEDFICGE